MKLGRPRVDESVEQAIQQALHRGDKGMRKIAREMGVGVKRGAAHNSGFACHSHACCRAKAICCSANLDRFILKSSFRPGIGSRNSSHIKRSDFQGDDQTSSVRIRLRLH